MSVYKETDAMVEHRTQCAFKGKREHIAKVNIPNIAYQSQHFDTEIPHGTRHHVIVNSFYVFSFDDTEEKVAVRFRGKKVQDVIYDITLCKYLDPDNELLID